MNLSENIHLKQKTQISTAAGESATDGLDLKEKWAFGLLGSSLLEDSNAPAQGEEERRISTRVSKRKNKK